MGKARRLELRLIVARRFDDAASRRLFTLAMAVGVLRTSLSHALESPDVIQVFKYGALLLCSRK
jgi:hypothetical protein